MTNSIRNKTVLVTGGAGFIGSHVVDRLLAEGAEKVIVVSNFFLGNPKNLTEAGKHDNFELIKQNVADYDGLKKIFDKKNIDVVFNMAVIPLPVSLEKPEWCVEQNVDMTLNVCKLQRDGKFDTLIQYSSSEAYGTARKVPMAEDHILLPETPYAASKAATDHIAFSYHRTFGCDVAIIRPFNNYGPRQNAGKFAGVIPLTVNRMLNNEDVVITGDGEQSRDFIYVDDTARATLEVYKNNNTRGQIINCATGKDTSINKICTVLAKLLDYKKDFIYKDARPGDVRRHIADISLAKKLIGFSPEIGIEKGLKRTVEWYKQVKK